MAAAFAVVPRAEIFARTGIQFLPFNTLYQLIAHAGEGLPSRAARLLLIPDLVHAALTGREVVEYTNATTTQMVNAGTRAWDDLLLATLSLPRHLLGDIVPAGTVVGPLKPEVSDTLGLAGVPVVAPATHDTASAVVGTPLAAGEAYISSGTWSLVGVERAAPLVTPEVGRHNFTNEGGAFGTIRFLKNVMGLWILESCRAEWQVCGTDVTYERLLSEAAAIACSPGLVFPDDPRFLNPPGMRAALGAQMLERGAAMPAGPAAVTRVILDSLALRYASVLRAIEALTGEPLRRVHVTGGGSRNAYLNQATANATGLPVSAGPVEATVIGNVMVQAVSAGQFGSLGDARAYLRERVHVEEFEPRPSAEWDRLTQAYADLESVFD
jgi:rhamnulokinase